MILLILLLLERMRLSTMGLLSRFWTKLVTTMLNLIPKKFQFRVFEVKYQVSYDPRSYEQFMQLRI